MSYPISGLVKSFTSLGYDSKKPLVVCHMHSHFLYVFVETNLQYIHTASTMRMSMDVLKFFLFMIFNDPVNVSTCVVKTVAYGYSKSTLILVTGC